MTKATFDSHGIEVSIQTISPIQASEILDSVNINNRKLSRARVSQYKIDMVNGDWRFNGDVIRIDESGILIDGQHRLTAVAQSGLPCEFLVVKGIQSKVKHTIDSGKGRTGGDALAIQAGVAFSDSHTINSALYLLSRYRVGGYGMSSGGSKLTNSQVLDAYASKKDLVDHSFLTMKDNLSMQGLLLPKSDVLFLYLVFSEIDEEDAQTYMKKIFTGAGIEDGSIEMNMRNLLLDSKMSVNKKPSKILVNSVMKCWNSLRRGSTLKHKKSCLWKPMSDKPVIAK